MKIINNQLILCVCTALVGLSLTSCSGGGGGGGNSQGESEESSYSEGLAPESLVGKTLILRDGKGNEQKFKINSQTEVRWGNHAQFQSSWHESYKYVPNGDSASFYYKGGYSASNGSSEEQEYTCQLEFTSCSEGRGVTVRDRYWVDGQVRFDKTFSDYSFEIR